MIGHNQRAISGAATAEHREAEHARYITSASLLHKHKETFAEWRIRLERDALSSPESARRRPSSALQFLGLAVAHAAVHLSRA
jgi:hypothetical protein